MQKKWLPLFGLILILFLFYMLNLQQYFTFATLQTEHHFLREWVKDNFILSLFTFSLLYVIVSASSLPIAAFLTILGGFLFGPFVSVIAIDISATVGSTLLFLALTSTFGDILQQKATPWVQKMEKGFQKNAFSYLLFLRLMPLFPFWTVTLVPALLGVSLRVFFWATLIGIIPGTIVYSLIGDGLGALLEQGKTPDIYIIFNPRIFLPICGLAFLSLLPIIYKKRKKINETTKS